ncbi:protein FAM98A [Trichonephila inaurata madagascariensis]|uniref:Protein FAM98A n=1 Tax=Trichonephila inaurata madagascariensis TaxID=2747483 RepID=A0A8X6XMT0_9ARAC|nr:protein FAM98A [Trichonephila inaurata madagascariensis]
MEFDVLDSMDDLGYSVAGDNKINEAIEIGPKSIVFTQLIEWLSKELQAICGLDSCVNAITDPEDSSSFLLEVSSFLKELRCPYKALVTGLTHTQHAKSFFDQSDYLCTELQAARAVKAKEKKLKAFEIEVDTSSTASSLETILEVLDIKLGENDDPITLISEIENKVKEKISSDPSLVECPALNTELDDQQWNSVNDLYRDFLHEYKVRRELLLSRLDVTIQSFKWGEGSKGKETEIKNVFVPKRMNLKKNPAVKVSDVVAARESIFCIEKTSNDELVKNTKSSVNRILIPSVPDRGGRPKEQKPPVEMPGWSKRSGGGGRGDYRGGRGGGRHGGQKKFRGPKGGDRSSGNFDAAGKY